MSRISDLSEEVIEDILSLLSPEPLMRFKCVSKSWHALIDDQKFVAKQLTNQIQSSSTNDNKRGSPCILFKHQVVTSCGENETVLSFLSYDNKTEAATLANCDVSLKSMNLPYKYCGVIGHYNGIVGLIVHAQGFKFYFILVNPAMREFRLLPESCIPPPPPLHSPSCYELEDFNYPKGVGFGYDHKIDDYKVVRIWSYITQDFGWEMSVRIEVFTLKTDCWREINTNLIEIPIVHGDFDCATYFNGFFCWWVTGIDGESKVILAFNFSDEAFQIIPSPYTFSFWDASTRILSVLGESLVLFDFDSPVAVNHVDVWAMDEYCIDGTWSKILIIGPLEGIERPLVFLKKDELLMGDINGQVVLYNIGTKQISNRLPFYDISKKWSVEIYVKSLLSVNRSSRV
ncbi:F-box domain-containing protein/FBA_1 domain-containing protein [Cephalotus follicularis]|uniref:F-box domain-containing protein/FBA_1 domain-containing protein n=1 Tax=Cephalotus follicularis TaxID=3775 RepID=A0A1Q3AZS6_CEPFO|nr:F-box domain-containing protein/FBA_1 domain-containing protein [Cephalotus follicularis]